MKLTAFNNVKIPVSAVLGNTELSVEELNSLCEGNIVELRSFAGEPIDLYAAGEKVGKGEVVIIDDNFGLRITSIERK